MPVNPETFRAVGMSQATISNAACIRVLDLPFTDVVTLV